MAGWGSEWVDGWEGVVQEGILDEGRVQSRRPLLIPH